MAAVAEALQVAFFKLLQIASMWVDVVNVGSPNAMPYSGTFPAPWFPHKLIGAAFLPAIAWIRVEIMPGSRRLPDGLGFVGWAVTLTG